MIKIYFVSQFNEKISHYNEILTQYNEIITRFKKTLFQYNEILNSEKELWQKADKDIIRDNRGHKGEMWRFHIPHILYDRLIL